MSDTSPVSGARTTQWNAFGKSDTDAPPITAAKRGDEKEVGALSALTAAAPTTSALESTPKSDSSFDYTSFRLTVAGYQYPDMKNGGFAPPPEKIYGVLTTDDPDVLGVFGEDSKGNTVPMIISRQDNPYAFANALTALEKLKPYLGLDDNYGKYMLGGYGVLAPNLSEDEIEKMGISEDKYGNSGITGVYLDQRGGRDNSDNWIYAIQVEDGPRVVTTVKENPELCWLAFNRLLELENAELERRGYKTIPIEVEHPPVWGDI